MNGTAPPARYRLTEADYLRANRHACWQSYRWVALLIIILLPVGIWEAVVTGKADSFALIWSVLMALFLLILFQVYLPRRSARVYAETKSLHDEQRLELSAQQAQFESDSGLYRLRWQEVHKWAEFSGMFALYPSSAMVVLIPTTQVDPATLDYAKAQLAASGLPKAGKARRT